MLPQQRAEGGYLLAGRLLGVTLLNGGRLEPVGVLAGQVGRGVEARGEPGSRAPFLDEDVLGGGEAVAGRGQGGQQVGGLVAEVELGAQPGLASQPVTGGLENFGDLAGRGRVGDQAQQILHEVVGGLELELAFYATFSRVDFQDRGEQPRVQTTVA